jgi:pantothenate kinase type III
MAKRRIHAKGDFQQEEALAGGTITPGMLIELNSAGAVIAHNSEGAIAERAFAIEDALQGKTVSDNYSSGALVTYILPTKGACVNALLKDAYNYAIGDLLVSAGDGKLKPVSGLTSAALLKDTIAVCTEALDLTATSTLTDTLSEVRIL